MSAFSRYPLQQSVYWRDVTLSDEATVPLPQLMYEEDFSQRWSG
jgi:hypothetical protein